jgi:hypothetical protein
MNGPEHYREAEYLLASSINLRAELLSGSRENEPADYVEPDRVVALAQVHATLALAAAAALNVAGGMDRYDYGEWHKMLSVNPNAKHKVDPSPDCACRRIPGPQTRTRQTMTKALRQIHVQDSWDLFAFDTEAAIVCPDCDVVSPVLTDIWVAALWVHDHIKECEGPPS